MGALSSISTILNGTPSPHGKGTVTIREATFPVSTTNGTVPFGNLSSNDLVEVYPVQAVTGFKGFCEVKASRTVSNAGAGVVTISTIDGQQGPASTCLLQVIVRRNT
jgi:hypothetical protein